MSKQKDKGTGKVVTASGRVPKAGPKRPGYRPRAQNRPGTDLMTAIREDRLSGTNPHSETPAVRRQRQLDQQATDALQHEQVTNLQEGSLARKVAEALITAFPAAAPFTENEQRVSRTTAAQRTALAGLTPAEGKRSKAVRLGINKARTALRACYVEEPRSPRRLELVYTAQ